MRGPPEQRKSPTRKTEGAMKSLSNHNLPKLADDCKAFLMLWLWALFVVVLLIVGRLR